MNRVADIKKALINRQTLVTRLIVSVSHLPTHMQFYVATSGISLEELERLVKFQERE